MQKYKEIRGKGPEIRILMNSNNFLETMPEKQLSVWFNFVAVATNVLGKNISADWKERIDRLMLSLQALKYISYLSIGINVNHMLEFSLMNIVKDSIKK